MDHRHVSAVEFDHRPCEGHIHGMGFARLLNPGKTDDLPLLANLDELTERFRGVGVVLHGRHHDPAITGLDANDVAVSELSQEAANHRTGGTRIGIPKLKRLVENFWLRHSHSPPWWE